MHIHPIPHFVWQVLRACKRAKSPPTGKELRIWPSRKTRDGKWLDELVEEGLLGVVSEDPVPDNPTPAERNLPVQFRRRYELTERGLVAAEFGECELNHRPRPPAPDKAPNKRKK
jgi:hypothetical protein